MADSTQPDQIGGKAQADSINDDKPNPLREKTPNQGGDACQIGEKSQKSTEPWENLEAELEKLRLDKLELQKKVDALTNKLDINRNELEREVQKRCEMEQGFTEDAKRSSDQIEELIAKSNQDDAKISDFEKRIEYYAEETSSMIESFTTSRETLSSQMQHLRYENDLLLGKFLAKNRELQNEIINLPQTVEELQFYCLNLSERLILATLAKERLEETIMQNNRGT